MGSMRCCHADPRTGELPDALQKLDPHILELVCNEVVDQGAGTVAWDDIAGQEPAKRLVQELVVWPMLNPHLFKVYLLPPLPVSTLWLSTQQVSLARASWSCKKACGHLLQGEGLHIITADACSLWALEPALLKPFLQQTSRLGRMPQSAFCMRNLQKSSCILQS